MDKKIASEFALGVVIFLAVLIGGIFFLQSRQDQSVAVARPATPMIVENPSVAAAQPNDVQGDGSCQEHYYEGDQQIHVWQAAQAQDDADGLVLNIQEEDVQTLPAKKDEQKNQASHFTVKLVDASEAVRNELEGSSEENPAEITIKGYAQVCTEPPLVSIQPATVAFKKG